MQYRLKTQTELIGTERLEIESLANLNETIDELFAQLEREGKPELLESLCPYFGVVWPSARALAGTLAELGHGALTQKRVLEVGCGLALPSLLAARLGAEVVATDFHPDIERFLTRNRELNNAGVRYVGWDWSREGGPGLGLHDLVIGSDILYERQHPAPVARMLAAHVAPHGRVLLADPGRPYLQDFSDEMRVLGFVCEVQARTVADEPAPKDIFVLSFRRS